VRFIYHFLCSFQTYTIDGIIERDKMIDSFESYKEVKEELKSMFNKNGVDINDQGRIIINSLTFLHLREAADEDKRQKKD